MFTKREVFAIRDALLHTSVARSLFGRIANHHYFSSCVLLLFLATPPTTATAIGSIPEVVTIFLLGAKEESEMAYGKRNEDAYAKRILVWKGGDDQRGEERGRRRKRLASFHSMAFGYGVSSGRMDFDIFFLTRLH